LQKLEEALAEKESQKESQRKLEVGRTSSRSSSPRNLISFRSGDVGTPRGFQQQQVEWEKSQKEKIHNKIETKNSGSLINIG